MRPLLSSALVVTTLMFNTACSVFGVESVEEAPYQSFLKDKEFEIRDYAPYVVAQTRVEAEYGEASNTAFRKLFAYISGENEAKTKIAMTAPVIVENPKANSGEKIAMTAPVITEQDGESWVFRFVLPESNTLDNSPSPLNPDVSLALIPAKRVATIRFSGRLTEKSRAKNTASLLRWMEAEGLEQRAEPRWAGYNAPWALPPLRRNEVLIDIATP